MTRRAFTLIETLVATVLFGVLMAGVLFVLAGLSRDRAAVTSTKTSPRTDAIVDLLRRDLIAAETMTRFDNGQALVLVGHGGISRSTLSPTGRMSRITYRIQRSAGGSQLVREQRYVDDRATPEPWRELVARDIQRIDAIGPRLAIPSPLRPELAEVAGRGAIAMPARVRLRIERSDSVTTEDVGTR